MKLKNTILLSLSIILVLLTAALVYRFITIGHLNKPLSKSAAPATPAPSDAANQSSFSVQFPAASSSPSQNCNIETAHDIVRGNSMSGIAENGQEITVLKGYYQCHEVQRNDLVIYSYAGNKNSLIKIVKGIPGDRWGIKSDSQGYEIIVNGSPLKTSRDKLYQIPTGNIKMLGLYASSYPTIPENAYLILGNLPYGTLDSVRFGLIGKQDIIGKVIVR